MARATATPRKKGVSYFDQSEAVQNRLFKSLKLWTFYADLEESAGTIDSCKAVYDRILELKIATPQIIMNYALFLEENKFFEESYKVYERGIEAFGYPVAFELWNIYLNKFVKRYVSDILFTALFSVLFSFLLFSFFFFLSCSLLLYPVHREEPNWRDQGISLNRRWRSARRSLPRIST